MPGPFPTQDWSLARRLGVAAGAGAAWSALWLGLLLLGQPTWIFLAGPILFGPVVALMAHRWRELAFVLLLTLTASAGTAVLLLAYASGNTSKPWPEVARDAAILWTPTGIIGAIGWFVWHRMQVGRRP